jgi:hypothetical protein
MTSMGNSTSSTTRINAARDYPSDPIGTETKAKDGQSVLGAIEQKVIALARLQKGQR